MKTKLGFGKLAQCELKTKSIIAIMVFLVFISCQKNETGLQDYETLKDPDMETLQGLSSNCSFRHMTLYYGHEIFRRGYGAPVVETRIISNSDFSCYQDKFVLMIRSGYDKRSRVASGEVWIDGKLIVRQSEFNKNIFLIVKYISGLTPESKLEVKLNGTPGSYIDLWIEGTMKKVTPFFEQISPLCRNITPPVLPDSSLNAPPIAGTWQPAVINTSIVGKTTYVFTPESGQCGTNTSIDIEVIESVIPAFEPVGPLAMETTAPLLPSVSTNNVMGTWMPEIIDTSKPGKYTFTFTPAVGQCAGPVTIEIEITGNQTISDVDGNFYKIVKIEGQWWMAENLKTTRYNNGDIIGTTIPASLDISGQIEPKYQWSYNGDENNVPIYGRLYTWYTATDIRSICPTGWHVPTDVDWTSLTYSLIMNGFGYEGSGDDIAKSLASRTGWSFDPIPGNVGNDPTNNNLSGFTAYPGGARSFSGSFVNLGSYTSWWSSSEYNLSNGISRRLYSNFSIISAAYSNKKHGAAIRCMKNN